MIEIGLWVKTEEGEVFLIQKDPFGHPSLSALNAQASLDSTADQKTKLRELYEKLTGHVHPHPDATSRQLMWDFLEAAIQHLP